MQLDSLPIYVAENIDRVPTTKWLDGELQVLLCKLSTLERDNRELRVELAGLQGCMVQHCVKSDTLLAELGERLRGLDSTFTSHLSTLNIIATSTKCDVMEVKRAMEIVKPATEEIAGETLPMDYACGEGTGTRPNQPNRDSVPDGGIGRWADQDTLAKVRLPPPTRQAPPVPSARATRPTPGVINNFRGHADRLLSRTTADTESETDFCDGGDGGDWQTAGLDGRRAYKRRRQESRLQQPSGRPSATPATAQPREQSRRRVRVLGAGNNDKIKASSYVLNKRVYAVSNVASELSTDDIVAFLNDCQVNVVNCFQANSRFENSKTFRVCITENDEAKFLDPTIWPKNVIIRNWHFKPKKDQCYFCLPFISAWLVHFR